MSVVGKDGILRGINRETHEQIYEVPLTLSGLAIASPNARFAPDSPLEEDGFELVVPPRTKRL
jgi:hypothetical protein